MGVLGNNDLIITEPGEVLSHGKVYSYDTKYLHPFETSSDAQVNFIKINELKLLASKAFKCTGCQGYARVDFLLDEKENIFINEINTLPGFTSISMFPKLMQKSGVSYKDLITKIIQLALE
jgi:D-alanine-D-alanine ligase